MTTVTFQVLEGVDKGRIFRDLPTPVTIGREEGNVLRLNDERVSRFHAKIQQDNGDIILTDLESTNGTKVNNAVVQIRRLRPGDRIGVGRSILLYGSDAEIRARLATLGGPIKTPTDATVHGWPFKGSATMPAQGGTPLDQPELGFDLTDEIREEDGDLYLGRYALPPLPQKLTPAQAARIAEVLDFLHRGLTSATEEIEANDDGTQVTISFADWQRLQSVQMLLARYLRAVTEPDALQE